MGSHKRLYTTWTNPRKRRQPVLFYTSFFPVFFLRGLTEWLSLFPVPLHLFLFVFHIEMEYIVSGRLGKDWQGRVKPSCCTLDWLELLLRVCGPVWPSLGTIWPLPFRCIQLGQPHCDLQGGSGRWPSISLRARSNNRVISHQFETGISLFPLFFVLQFPKLVTKMFVSRIKKDTFVLWYLSPPVRGSFYNIHSRIGYGGDQFTLLHCFPLACLSTYLFYLFHTILDHRYLIKQ